MSSLALKDFDLLSDSEKAEAMALLKRYDALEKQESAQQNFLSFVKTQWPDFIEGRHHRIIAEKFDRIAARKLKRLIVCLPPRHCLELDTPVLTTDGWKTMAEVQVGDHVFGPDGKPTRVTGKSPVYEDVELYRVTTNDGASVITDAKHRWWVRLDRKHKQFKEYTTEELWCRDQGAFLRRHKNGTLELKPGMVQNPRAAMIPDSDAAELPEQDLLVDPYVLGLWLGDGNRTQAIITAHDDDAGFYRAEFARRGYETTDQATYFTFGVLGLKVKLRDLGVLGNKHIPEAYMIGSIEQRKDLVRGLMDSDGNVSKAGQCFFAQKDRALIDQFRELLWSLGVRNTVQISEAKIGDRSYGLTYKVSFYAPDLCLMPRKRERAKATIHGRFIRIEKRERRGDVQCVQVERDDDLFLAGKGLVCTMNSKSEFASTFFPAWMMGRRPNLKIIQATHTAELAVRFGRRVRNIIDSDEFQEVFPSLQLEGDNKSAGRWTTNGGGEAFYSGVGGAITGRGADLLVIDDPVSEQDALSATALDGIYEWYTSGPRQRLQPGGIIVIVMTRWSTKDLVGRVLKKQGDDYADQWEVVEFPAIMPESEEPLWPEYWKKEELLSVKASLPIAKWNAQWMQNPTAEEGSIVKREWWRRWEPDHVPAYSYVIQSYDTAYSKKETADYSAITTWAIFQPENDGPEQIILLDAKRLRVDFPELKRAAMEEYRYWEPDCVLIEAKASGTPLTHELRRMGIPVTAYTPSRGQDKIARMNSVAPIFESGMVWAPEQTFAEEVIEEMASFPYGDHDDFCDSATMALMRFRQGGFVTLDEDYQEEMRPLRRDRVVYY